MNILWESLFGLPVFFFHMQQPCSIFLCSLSTNDALQPQKKECLFTYYFPIIDDQNRNTEIAVRSHFNSLFFFYLFPAVASHIFFFFGFYFCSARGCWYRRTRQMWRSLKLAGLTLDSVWVMKAIRPTVTLTCQPGVVYRRLRLCPSLTYTEVVNTISTSGEAARRAAPLLLQNHKHCTLRVTCKFVQSITLPNGGEPEPAMIGSFIQVIYLFFPL